jgi:hypothetical protein
VTVCGYVVVVVDDARAIPGATVFNAATASSKARDTTMHLLRIFDSRVMGLAGNEHLNI